MRLRKNDQPPNNQRFNASKLLFAVRWILISILILICWNSHIPDFLLRVPARDLLEWTITNANARLGLSDK